MKTVFASIPARSAILLAAMTAASLIPAHATDLYWGGWDGVLTSAAWSTAGNWYTDAGESIVSGAAPTAADDLFFNTTPDNALGGTINLSGNIAATSLTFNTSAATIISQNGTTRSLSLGSGGITVNSGAVPFGASTAALPVQLTGNQTWTNNSSTGLLTVRSLAVSDTATGPVALTLNAAGSSNISFLLAIQNSPDTTKALSLVVDSTGTGTVQMANAASTFSGGIVIKQGNLQASTNNATLGTGKVEIGDTTGSSAARLTITGTTPVIANHIDIRTGSTGLKTMAVGTSAANATLSGNIALFDDLTVGTALTSGTNPILNLTGVISGSGDLTVGSIGGSKTVSLILAGTNTYSGNTIVSAGSLTLADTGTLTFYIGANGVNNQISGGGTNAATFNGTFAFDLSGASQVDGNSWTLVNVGTLAESFAGTFAVSGFTEAGNVWTSGGFSFAEATGILSFSAVPEPSTYALLAGAGALLITGVRRVRNRRAA